MCWHCFPCLVFLSKYDLDLWSLWADDRILSHSSKDQPGCCIHYRKFAMIVCLRYVDSFQNFEGKRAWPALFEMSVSKQREKTTYVCLYIYIYIEEQRTIWIKNRGALATPRDVAKSSDWDLFSRALVVRKTPWTSLDSSRIILDDFWDFSNVP